MTINNYKSERVNNITSLIKKWLIYSVIISIPILIDFLFPGWIPFIHSNRSFWYLMFFFFSLQMLITLFQEDTVNEISIDTTLRQIQIQFYDSNYGQVTKNINFEDLQIKSVRLIWSRDKNVNAIYFFTSKNKMFKITKWKDGFSKATLNQLSEKLELLTSPKK